MRRLPAARAVVCLLQLTTLWTVAPLTANAKAQLSIGINHESYPPLYWKASDGRWLGWEMDLLHAVCTELDVTCVEREISWDGLIPALQARQIDIIWASMSITEERAVLIDFTHFYYNTPNIIIGPKDEVTSVRCDALESFAGAVIGAEAGSTLARFLLVGAPKSVRINTYDTVDNMLADLSIGRIDFAMEGGSTLASFLLQNPEFELKTVCPFDAHLGSGIGAGVRKGDTSLQQRVSAAILRLSADGTWATITANYPVIKDFMIKP